MKKVIFLCRFQKSPGDPVFQEIEDDLRIRSLTEPDFDKDEERNKLLDRETKLFEYQPVFFDVKDITTANAVDTEHTHVVLYNGSRYTLKINFDKYINIYSELTGVVIYDFAQEGEDTLSVKLLEQTNGK
jgi:hypothetical protein